MGVRAELESEPPVTPETDDELRKRVLYVAGDGEVMTLRIQRAHASRLDELAEALGLKRRRA